MREYEKYEFCEAVDCPFLENSKCDRVDGLRCTESARAFHEWIKSKGGKIMMPAKED